MLNNVNEIIDRLEIGNKVFLDDGRNPYVGFVVSVDSDSIMINIYVPDINISFNRKDIVEISVV